MTNKLCFSAAFATVLFLSACGGGDNSIAVTPTTPVAPTPLPTLPAVVPDVTFAQVATNLPVTPGETFRPILIAVTCPLMVGTQSCMKTLPLGEVGFTSDLALQKVKLLYDGIEMAGLFNQEGKQYRFTPTGYSPIWKPGVMEVIATLSPTASDGAKTTMVVQAADASIDKTLSVVSDETTVTVKALPYNAPAIITPLPVGNGFFYFCPLTTIGGCQLNGFNATVNGAAAWSEVRLNIGNLWWNQLWTDSNGYLSDIAYANYMVPSGETIIVQVMSIPGKFGPVSVQFNDFKSMSGDKLIEPIVPAYCTPVSLQYCRG